MKAVNEGLCPLPSRLWCSSFVVSKLNGPATGFVIYDVSIHSKAILLLNTSADHDLLRKLSINSIYAK